MFSKLCITIRILEHRIIFQFFPIWWLCLLRSVISNATFSDTWYSTTYFHTTAYSDNTACSASSMPSVSTYSSDAVYFSDMSSGVGNFCYIVIRKMCNCKVVFFVIVTAAVIIVTGLTFNCIFVIIKQVVTRKKLCLKGYTVGGHYKLFQVN